MRKKEDLARFLDDSGRLTLLPAKRGKKLLALAYLAQKLTPGREYSERQLGEALNAWHTFGDPATLRRELYDFGFVDRTPDGSVYRLADPQPDPQAFL